MSDPQASKGKPSDPKTQAAEHDEDPANPTESTPESAAADASEAIALANYGDPAANQEFDLTAESFAEGFEATSTLEVDIAVASDFLRSCMTSNPRVKYGLGSKVSPHGAVPGSGFKKVDCSGFVRETIWRSTAPHFNFPDGSVVQHDFIRDQGYERCTRTDASLNDGKVRIAFLRPQDSASHIGHVALVHNGKTLESHGSFGPNARAWTSTGWQAKATVYILKN